MEKRASNEIRRTGRKLTGYAAKFNSPTNLGEFTETIQPGAFASALAADSSENIRAIYEHDSKSLLGRVGAGTLRLYEDEVGLAFELDLPNTSLGRDLEELVTRGDIAGCSFGFISRAEDWSTKDGSPLRTLTDLDLHEITITSQPAYASTSVQVRSRKGNKVKYARLYLEAIS